MPTRPSLLFVTDLNYPAQGRRYGDEDTFLSAQLRSDFRVALCHPLDAVSLMDQFDAILVRNSGPVLHYPAGYEQFRAHARASGARVYTQLSGQADMAGKQYLIDLTAAGYPVIPTADTAVGALATMPEVREYVVKPKAGADSIGLRFVPRPELSALASALNDENVLIQPRIDFRHEISFYYVDHDFQYALYAPDPAHRWKLERYDPEPADLKFAQRFIEWNTIEHGIQRVDACRTREGELLLVELEDLNPYLSLDLLDNPTRAAFVHHLKAALHRLLAG